MIDINIRDLSKRRSRGFTLTELAIVLGIAGIILGAIWAAAGSVYRNQHVAKAQQQLTLLSTSIKSFYSTRNTLPDTEQLMTTALLDAGAIPGDIGKTFGSLTSGIGGTLRILPWPTAPGSRAFIIAIQNIISDTECRTLALNTAGDNPLSGLSRPAQSVFNNIDGWRSVANATTVGPGICTALAWVFSMR